ncbi:MAG: hypothetical protein JKY01_12140 [Pseudomonadales bacterium]|nr:hypothetical protein [Pseudomonadales bacterium]
MTLPEWFNVSGEALGWLALVSFTTFVGSLLLIPVLVIKLPEDYFVSTKRPVSHFKQSHPYLHYLIIAVKNMGGILLILAGIVMLVIPGQGLLTIFLGVFLMDFSGKYHLERRLIQQKQVRESINWIRLRANKQ